MYIPRSAPASVTLDILSGVAYTSEWIDRYQYRTDICVDLGICPSFLEVLVHTFVADSCQKGHVGNSDLFLLESFLPIGLYSRVVGTTLA